jgi:hypothetical protein
MTDTQDSNPNDKKSNPTPNKAGEEKQENSKNEGHLEQVVIDSRNSNSGNKNGNVLMNELNLPSIAFFLAKAIGCVIIVVLLFYFIDYVRNVIFGPRISIPTNISSDQIEQYQKLIEASNTYMRNVTTRINEGIVAVVAAILIPLFTSMVGYIFGYSAQINNGISKSEGDSKNSQD